MTLNLTPSMSIRLRVAEDFSSDLVRKQTRRLSITALTFLKLEIMVFRFHAE